MGAENQASQTSVDNSLAGSGLNIAQEQEEVRPLPPIDTFNAVPTGKQMDPDFLNQPWDDNWDDTKKELYYQVHVVGVRPTPESLAQDATRIMERQAKEAAEANDPLRRKQIEGMDATQRAAEDKTKEDAQKTYQRASNMLFLLDNLRGGNRETAKTGEEAWRPRVGRIQGGMHNPGGWMPQPFTSDKDMGWVADFNSLKGMINLEEAQRNRGQGPLSDGERVLMATAASLGLERQRDEPGFKVAFERMYDVALESQKEAAQKMSGESGGAAAPAQNAAQPATAPAAAPAAKPQAGFQVGKPYLDAKGRQRYFRGYAQDGRPLFSQ